MVDLIRYVQNVRSKKRDLLTEKLAALRLQVNSTPIGYDETKEVCDEPPYKIHTHLLFWIQMFRYFGVLYGYFELLSSTVNVGR